LSVISRDDVVMIQEGGFVKCWGLNNYGQLGLGTTEGTRQLTPVIIHTADVALRTCHTAGYEAIFGPKWAESRLSYPQEPPYIPTVLPTVRSRDYLLPGYLRNPFVLRCLAGG